MAFAVSSLGCWFQVVVAVDTCRIKNKLQIWSQCIINICLSITLAFQYGQVKDVNRRIPHNTDQFGVPHAKNVDGFWKPAHPALIACIVVSSVCSIAMCAIAARLHTEFSWSLYEHITPDVQMKRRHQKYLAFLVFLKISPLFTTMFVINYGFVTVHYKQPDFALTMAILPTLLIHAALATYWARTEHKFGMIVVIRPETVSSELAKDPSETPASIIKRLYKSAGSHNRYSCSVDSGVELLNSRDDLEMAFECGRWPPDLVPSPLFLQAFTHALACLEIDPMAGMVSPSLMGSHGRVPLTIIAPVVDIIRHITNLIRNAKKEIFLITCVWTPSVAQRLLRDALVELSKQAGLRGDRVKVRIMFDKASLWHAIEPHQCVNAEVYASKHIDLPLPDEIPNLDFEVSSLHKMMLGTLHVKMCVVDGKVATIMSNNIEDNVNLEMMTHLEGPIVAGVYDTALITWNKALSHHQVDSLAGAVMAHDVQPKPGPLTSEYLQHTDNIQNEIVEANKLYQSQGEETHLHAVNYQLNLKTESPIKPTGPEIADSEAMTPYISTLTPQQVPMALVSRPPYGSCDSRDVKVPQNEAWLSLVRNAKKSIFIQTPDLNAAPLLRELSLALRRGVEVTYYVCFGYNDAGEMIPGQGGTNEQAAQRLIATLPPDGPEMQLLNIYAYVAKDQDQPIHHSFRSRSCHIKLLIADESVGVQGSGNQDTQSWYHSQEVNVMVDSPEICAAWRDGIERNQNTRRFGKCPDGIWRNQDGTPGKGYSGDPGVVGGVLKGVAGMIKKTIHQSRGAKQTGVHQQHF
ncbi:IQ calmodulin-binding motif [Paramyrothecium foliicola]|nr:IQ calmodulin-binding motif [Paramyrothecium foliicola]